jgi:membrane protein
MAMDLHKGKGTGPAFALRHGGLLARAVPLTWYATLSLLGTLVALAAVAGLLGSHPATSDRVLELVGRLGPSGAVGALRGPIEELARNSALGIAVLLIGILAMVRFGSGYERVLQRAARQIREPHAWRQPRSSDLPAMLSVCVLAACLLAAVVLTGPVARAGAGAFGVGDTGLAAWSLAKWPAMAVCFAAVFLVLYRGVVSPRPAGTRALSASQLAAVLAWVVALAGVVFYVAHFGSIDETYGVPGASVVSLLWLMMLGVLYFVTPSLRLDGFGAVMPGLWLSLAIWLAASGGLAAAAVLLDPFTDAYRLLGLVAATTVWVWASNAALLEGALRNLELDANHALPFAPPPVSEHVVEPQPERSPAMTPDRNAIDLAHAVATALRDDTAHRHMWSILPGGAREAPALLSDLECDLNDWGFAYGVAWATARARYPLEGEEVVAARAREAAETVFREYCDGDDWSERLAERRAGLAEEPDAIERAGVPA